MTRRRPSPDQPALPAFEPEVQIDIPLDPDPGVAINLGARATALLVALDGYATASKLQGFLASRRHTEITKYGGPKALAAKIRLANAQARAALREGYGISEMLAHPEVFADKDGYPYHEQLADDDMIGIANSFRRTYTIEGLKGMPSDATARERQQRARQIEAERATFRTQLKQQTKK